MGEMKENGGVTDLSARVQYYGVLSKRPFGHTSNKWMKRFFLIKDGFLLYYPDSERKEFEKKKFLNIHPRGIIPLGGCSVESSQEQGQPFAIHIKSEEINCNVVLAAESEYERDKWVNFLRKSCRVTFHNVQLGDTLIQQLENEGLKMAHEKQVYFDKLQNEAMALHDEKQKTEELEKVKEELEQEKEKMEELALELRTEHEKLKMDFEDTVEAMKSIEDERIKLSQNTQELQLTLEELAKERHNIMAELEDQMTETLKLSHEKHELSETQHTMQSQLKAIEEKTQELLEEKAMSELRLREKEERAQQLEEEKALISEHAMDLQESIKDLSAQKAVTEKELKEEIIARLEAERRLHEAEESLKRLDMAVRKEGTEGRNEEELREEMIFDVGTLKRFFEKLAFEQTIEATKTGMIKNAIQSRRSCVRRAQTLKFEASKKRRSKPGGISSLANGPRKPLFVTSELDLRSPDAISPSDLALIRHSSVDLTTPTLSVKTEEQFV